MECGSGKKTQESQQQPTTRPTTAVDTAEDMTIVKCHPFK